MVTVPRGLARRQLVLRGSRAPVGADSSVRIGSVGSLTVCTTNGRDSSSTALNRQLPIMVVGRPGPWSGVDVIRAARRGLRPHRHRDPWDGSVVGDDDSPIARLGHVNLMTVSQNTEGLTEQAVKAIVERLDSGRTHQGEVVVHPRLVIRGTTGQPLK